MGIGKRGIFFTLIALLVLSIFIVIFTWDPGNTDFNLLYSDRARVQVATSYTHDLKEVFIPRILWSSSELALTAMIDRVSRLGAPIDNVSMRLEEIVMEGTLYGTPVPSIENRTVRNLTEKMMQLARDEFRIYSNITIMDVYIKQDSPWSVVIYADVFIYTNYSDIQYRVPMTVATNRSIIGRLEPFFVLNNTNRTIKRFMPEEWNTSAIEEHIANKTFTYSPFAPSYLTRLEGRQDYSDCCGIEAFIDTSYGDYNYSSADHLFFNQTDFCPDSLFDITNVSWVGGGNENFKLDGVHMYWYGFTELDSGVQKIIC